jgi:hypothetical protein
VNWLILDDFWLVFGREVVDWSGLMGLVCFLELLVGSPPAIEDDFLKKNFMVFH